MNAETIFLANNSVYLYGAVDSKLEYSHELFGEDFFEFKLKVARLSRQFDIIPITISSRLLNSKKLEIGEYIAINGQFRSYNKIIEDRSKLMLTVFVRELAKPNEENPNQTELSGYICKPPIYRTTPFNREICDLLLAVNRAYNKSDYIPCIAWGRNARFVRSIDVGQKLSIVGRIQSREYQKKINDIDTETRIAYELSINRISLVDEASFQSLGEVASTLD